MMNANKRKCPSSGTPRLDRTTLTGEELGTGTSSASANDGVIAPDGAGGETISKKFKKQKNGVRIGTWNIRTLRPETLGYNIRNRALQHRYSWYS